MTQENRKLKTVRQIAMSPQGISSFASDEQGNIYVVGYEGMIYKIDFTSSSYEESSGASSALPAAGKNL